MDAQFWHQVWEKNQLGFQLEQPHPMLERFSSVFENASQIFVPLCGKSPDMHLLAHYAPVFGVDLSAIACAAFFSEAGAVPLTLSNGHLQDKNVTLCPSDIFLVEPRWLTGCKHIYDRAALIALPATMREEYAALLKRLVPSATLLLLTVDYPQQEMTGPPFAVDETEIRRLFPGCELQLLAEQDLTGQKFARRLLPVSRLTEQAWLLRW